MSKPVYYLASPYTHKDKSVQKERAAAVTKAAVDLLKREVFVFAPISYNAPWEQFDLPGDWQFWEKFDKAFVDKMDGVIVFQIPGWKESVGVTAEIEYAKSIGKPVYYLTEEQIADYDYDLSELVGE